MTGPPQTRVGADRAQASRAGAVELFFRTPSLPRWRLRVCGLHKHETPCVGVGGRSVVVLGTRSAYACTPGDSGCLGGFP